ncbi:MAG: chromosomal replication initiator protein DnaA [Lactobacillus sp.]|nr:chromosomal replication initiator protein DnaA [Lactobacillus sp.]
MFDFNRFWQFFDSDMQQKYNEVTYNAWFKATKPVSYDEDSHELVISVQNKLSQNYWEKMLSATLIQSAYAYAQIQINPVFVVSGEEPTTNISFYDEKPKEAPKAEPKVRSVTNSVLNPRYTFENFIQGNGSTLAQSAALAVAENPGKFYNPLFIYGKTGLGKTHLMQAVGNQVLEVNPDAKIIYVQSETFFNEYIEAISNGTISKFHEKYRHCDYLLVDDIQFFSKKESVQGEFFHTFEALYNNNKQIILTSDRLANEISDLSDRLVSRFTWGLSVQITPPDLETRIAILRKKSEYDHLDLDFETLEYVASQIDSNVRELEGALTAIQASAAIKKQAITLDLAKSSLAELHLVHQKRGIQVPKVIEFVANYFRISTEDIKGKKRVKQIVIPRQIAMYLSRNLTNASLPKIGQEFGGKDHTTVMHACTKIEKDLETDAELKRAVEEITHLLER